MQPYLGSALPLCTDRYFLYGKVADGLIEGMKFSKQVYIISDKYKEISDAIMTRMEEALQVLRQKECIQMRRKICFFV